MKSPLLIQNTVRLKSVGSCIYCGSTKQLTDEHIVPFALGGRLILPDSSCFECAKITSLFEQKVLRGFMLNARTTGKFPTRRQKERPKTLPLAIEKEGELLETELSPDEHPGLLHLPMLEPPGYFVGRDPKEGLTIIGLETIQFGQSPYMVAKKLNATAITSTTNLDVWSFARLLAKIGYCFAISELGLLPREKIPILPFILGKDSNASMWLGSANFQLSVEAQNPTHAMSLVLVDTPNKLTKVLIARIKFFAPCGATGYEVYIYEPDDINSFLEIHHLK